MRFRRTDNSLPIHKIVDEAHQEFPQQLRHNRDKLGSLASAFLDHETLDVKDVSAPHRRERRLWSHCGQFRVAAMHQPTGRVKLETMIRCLIVDDSASVLEAAASVLRRDGVTVAGTAGTTEDALRQAHELRPDVVLIDVRLGSESGFDLARRLPGTGLEAVLILISTHDAADLADLIAATPAAGFVAKSELSADAIRRFVSGPRDK
jgi:CheY-like chemotaxis protein